MANKKINELSTRTPSLTDLLLVGDPSSGYSYKATVTALADIIQTDISDAYVTLDTTQTISGAKTFSNTITATSIANSPTDTDKFLVLNASNIINYRTGAEVLSDIGGQGTLTLTTTGSSGASTLVSNTLNIPTYTLSGLGGVPSTRQLTINGTAYDLSADRTWSVGTVTSVALSVPTGLSITGSPITSSGTLAISLQSGYSIPTTASQANWDAAYNDKINSAAVTGTTTKTLTLTQQDGGTVTASWTDDNTDAVTSVFGRTGAVVATEGDYSLTQLSDVTITSPTTGQVLKYNGTTWVNDTDANTGTVTSVALSAPTGFSVSGSPVISSGTLTLSFASGYSLPTTASQTNWDTAYTNRITSLTTTGSSGSATLVSNTLNIPTYTLAGLGGISLTSLSASAPLSYNNTTGAFSISQSTTSTDGYLSSTDWNTFNNKQSTITLTTTGSSGSATFVSNTLNIPTYTLSGLGGVSGSGTTNYIPKFTSSSAIGNSVIYESSSNIGIGTITPSAKLEVNGSLIAGGTNAKLFVDDNTQTISFYNNGGERVRINSGGELLIGTTTDAGDYKLQVNGNLYLQNSNGVTIQTNATNKEALFGNGQVYQQLTTPIIGGITYNTVSYSNTTVAGDPLFFSAICKPDGSNSTVSIGDVTTLVNGTTLAIDDATRRITASSLDFYNQGSLGVGTNTIGSKLQVNGNAAIGYSASTAAPTNGLVIAGNVGIGTTSPTEKLEVQNGTSGAKVKVSNTVGGYATLEISSSAASIAQISYTNQLSLIGGNVGIATNSPGSALDVKGTIRLSGSTSGYVGLAPAATAGSTTYTLPSADGTNGQVLSTNGSGVLSWATASGSGTVSGTTNYLAKFTSSTAVGNSLLFDDGTNVGISTTTAGSKLQINGSAAIGYSASTAAPTNGLQVAGNTIIGGTTNRLRLTVSGNDALAPSLGTASGTTIFANAAGTTEYGMNFGIASTGYGWIQQHRFDGTATAYNLILQPSGGNIGIRTTTVGSTLQVNGNATIGYSASTAAPTNGLIVSGTVNIGTTTTTSKLSVSDKLRLWDSQPTGANSTTLMGYLFNGNVPAGLVLEEATGTILTFGINSPQIATRSNSVVGGIFRLDTRSAYQEFTVSGFPTGGAVENQRLGVNLQNGNTILAPVAGNVGIGISAYGTMGSKLQVNGNAAIGYSSSTAAPTNGLAVAGGVTIGTATNNVSSLVASGYSLTGANAQSLLDLAGTWNTTGNPTAIKLNITNTASGATADLMELQVGGVSQFTVTKGGAIQTSAPSGGTAKPWKLGEAGVTLGGSNTSGVRVEIDGTVYYLVTGYLP